MELAQKALLSTVDRILTERGADPSVISSEDKVSLAAQLVQLAILREHEMKKAAEELAEALGSSPDLSLARLASEARTLICMQRSAA